jgi:hypothetical protein
MLQTGVAAVTTMATTSMATTHVATTHVATTHVATGNPCTGHHKDSRVDPLLQEWFRAREQESSDSGKGRLWARGEGAYLQGLDS